MNKRKIFYFKSKSPFFEKERDGLKPNTVREIDLGDGRFTDLITWNTEGYNPGDIKIAIHNDKLKAQQFIRDINDISIWNNLMIISWLHKKELL